MNLEGNAKILILANWAMFKQLYFTAIISVNHIGVHENRGQNESLADGGPLSSNSLAK